MEGDLNPELSLSSLPGVEVDPGREEGLEGVSGGLEGSVWVPEGNLLLQLVGNLGEREGWLLLQQFLLLLD